MVTSGTGVQANIGDPYQWGKTGTTENNGDAWFCGATEEVTACVWVGYADTTTPMLTEFAGGPVDGGTFPALIWAGVISAWEDIRADRAAEAGRAAIDERLRPTSPRRPSYSAPSTPGALRHPRRAAPEPAAPAPAPSTPAPTLRLPRPRRAAA